MPREKPAFSEKISEETKEEKFSAKEALETPGFFEFVSRHAPEKVESLDQKEMEKLFGVFQATQETARFYQEILQEETGLTFDKKELQPALEAHFISKKENPAFLRYTVSHIRAYEDLQEQVHQRELEILRLGGEERIKKELEEKGKPLWEEKKALEEAKAIKETMVGVQGFFNIKNSELIGWLFRSEKESLARKESLEYWQEKIDEIRPEAEKYEKEEEILNSLENTRRQVVKLKTDLLGSCMGPVKEIMAQTREKIVEKLKGMADPQEKGVKKINEGLELVRKLAASDLGIMEAEELGEFEEKFDRLIKKKAAQHLKEQISKLRIEEGALGDLEAKINKYLKEGLALSEKERAKRHVRERLEAYLKREIPPKGETKESFRVKKIAIKCLLFKLA